MRCTGPLPIPEGPQIKRPHFCSLPKRIVPGPFPPPRKANQTRFSRLSKRIVPGPLSIPQGPETKGPHPQSQKRFSSLSKRILPEPHQLGDQDVKVSYVHPPALNSQAAQTQMRFRASQSAFLRLGTPPVSEHVRAFGTGLADDSRKIGGSESVVNFDGCQLK